MKTCFRVHGSFYFRSISVTKPALRWPASPLKCRRAPRRVVGRRVAGKAKEKAKEKLDDVKEQAKEQLAHVSQQAIDAAASNVQNVVGRAATGAKAAIGDQGGSGHGRAHKQHGSGHKQRGCGWPMGSDSGLTAAGLNIRHSILPTRLSAYLAVSALLLSL